MTEMMSSRNISYQSDEKNEKGQVPRRGPRMGFLPQIK